MNVPFADYRLAAGAEIILHQQVGSVPTKKPLLAVGEMNGRKSAVLYGDGIWRWALNEYARDENRETTEGLITKIIQYLSAKEDKRKFRLRPISDEFRDDEPAIFETEVYNTIYEKIYGQKVDLTLTDEKGESRNYSFVNSSEGFKFKLGGLSKGVYNYKAVSRIEGKTEQSIGEFRVRELQIEALNTAADPGLLRQLSERTGGQFVSGENLQKLHDRLLAEEPVQIIRSAEQIDDVLQLKQLFFLLAGLVCFEWFLRKFLGSY